MSLWYYLSYVYHNQHDYSLLPYFDNVITAATRFLI
jgi:hypothetical protein